MTYNCNVTRKWRPSTHRNVRWRQKATIEAERCASSLSVVLLGDHSGVSPEPRLLQLDRSSPSELHGNAGRLMELRARTRNTTKLCVCACWDEGLGTQHPEESSHPWQSDASCLSQTSERTTASQRPSPSSPPSSHRWDSHAHVYRVKKDSGVSCDGFVVWSRYTGGFSITAEHERAFLSSRILVGSCCQLNEGFLLLSFLRVNLIKWCEKAWGNMDQIFFYGQQCSVWSHHGALSIKGFHNFCLNYFFN